MSVDQEVQKALDRRRWLSQMYPMLPKDELLGGWLWAAVYSNGTCFIRHPKQASSMDHFAPRFPGTAEEMSGWYKLSNDGKDAYGPFDTMEDALTEQRPNTTLNMVKVRCKDCRFGTTQTAEDGQPYVLCQNETMSPEYRPETYPIMEDWMGCLKGEGKE